MNPNEQLISNLIRIRLDRRMTKRETATRCRIHYEKYEKIEQGQEELTIGLLNALSNGLGVNFFELMEIDVYQIPKYVCYESLYVTEDAEEVSTYGIAINCQTVTSSVCGAFRFHYSHLTTEKDELERLVNLMNREQLQLIHAEDVIEDFLT